MALSGGIGEFPRGIHAGWSCIGREDGQSITESALAAIATLTLFFGMMEICMGLYTFHCVSESARDGSRYAIVRGSSCSNLASACPAASSDVQNYVRGIGYPGIVPSDMTVTTTWPTTGSACTPSSSPCNNPGNLVKVEVQYTFPLSIPFIAANHLSFSSTSEMVISQ